MSESVERFAKTTRWFHWMVVLPFLSLAGSGAALVLRGPLALSERAVARTVFLHECAAVALLVLPAVVALSGRTGLLLRDLAETLRWSRSDLRWLALQPLSALTRIELPPAGKLNAGQKVNALVSMAVVIGFVASGILLWLRPGSLAPWFVHVALFVSWIPLFCGHFFLAVIHPGTRPALRGMVVGRVPRAWAEHHHAAWVRDLGDGQS
jgi:formate dehydrogenase subunit gamma